MGNLGIFMVIVAAGTIITLANLVEFLLPFAIGASFISIALLALLYVIGHSLEDGDSGSKKE